MLSTDQRDFLWLHLGFGALCAGVLAVGLMPIGQQLLLLVLCYNVAVPMVAVWRQHRTWLPIWYFAFVFGLFNIFPDWFLAAYLQVLVFPDEGVFKIGPIAGYMPGLWFIPIYILLYVGQYLRQRTGAYGAACGVLCLGMAMFWPTEQFFKDLGSWHAQGVCTVGQAAIYVLCAEALLSVAAFGVFSVVRQQHWLLKTAAAFGLMLVYMGSLIFFYFIIETP